MQGGGVGDELGFSGGTAPGRLEQANRFRGEHVFFPGHDALDVGAKIVVVPRRYAPLKSADIADLPEAVRLSENGIAVLFENAEQKLPLQAYGPGYAAEIAMGGRPKAAYPCGVEGLVDQAHKLLFSSREDFNAIRRSKDHRIEQL